MRRRPDQRKTIAPANPLPALQKVMSTPAIEGLARDVIKRLSSRHSESWQAPEPEVRLLCRALCARYPYAANGIIENLIAADVPLERIYGGYMTQAARLLGRLWERDSLSFEEVGIATTRLYLILNDLRRQEPATPVVDAPRIAFAVVPGEQHTLGVEMAADLFRREGWDVDHLVGMSHDEILSAVEDTDVVLIGLSASGKRRRAALLKLVVALRVARPDLKIVLSGEIANSEPDLIAEVGIDAIVRDIPEALNAVAMLAGPVRKRA